MKKLNICRLENYVMKMISYSLFGKVEDCDYKKEVSLDTAIFAILLGIAWLLYVFWWLAPIQFIVNKLNMRDIKFKCND